MLRQFVLGLGVYAAVCMSAGLASANDINLHCSVAPDPTRQGDPPWISNIPKNYRINLSDSAVNGEILQIDRINAEGAEDAEGQKLTWDSPADASVPAAHYILDLGHGALFVSFDYFKYDGRKFASAALLLLCINLKLKFAA
jgi:hypothetical protein